MLTSCHSLYPPNRFEGSFYTKASSLRNIFGASNLQVIWTQVEAEILVDADSGVPLRESGSPKKTPGWVGCHIG